MRHCFVLLTQCHAQPPPLILTCNRMTKHYGYWNRCNGSGITIMQSKTEFFFHKTPFNAGKLMQFFTHGLGAQPFLGCRVRQWSLSSWAQMKAVNGAGWWVIEANKRKLQPAHPPLENERIAIRRIAFVFRR
jgi:hypothetical protein